MGISVATKQATMLGGAVEVIGHGTYRGEEAWGFDEWYEQGAREKKRRPKTRAVVAFAKLQVHGIDYHGRVDFARDRVAPHAWRVTFCSMFRERQGCATRAAVKTVQTAALELLNGMPQEFWNEAERASLRYEIEETQIRHLKAIGEAERLDRRLNRLRIDLERAEREDAGQLLDDVLAGKVDQQEFERRAEGVAS